MTQCGAMAQAPAPEWAQGLTVADLLKKHREKEGASQVEAARGIGCALASYRAWEAKFSRPDASRWGDIIRWLRVDPIHFLFIAGVLKPEDFYGRHMLQFLEAETDLELDERIERSRARWQAQLAEWLGGTDDPPTPDGDAVSGR